jgi:hypothetical protein
MLINPQQFAVKKILINVKAVKTTYLAMRNKQDAAVFRQLKWRDVQNFKVDFSFLTPMFTVFFGLCLEKGFRLHGALPQLSGICNSVVNIAGFET